MNLLKSMFKNSATNILIITLISYYSFTNSALGLQFPPPQRPTSPIAPGRGIQSAKSRLRVTHTDTWLAGGKDLYWEAVRKRPKSGHVPGWKEGLPESMRRRQRPKSAYMPTSHQTFRCVCLLFIFFVLT